MQLMIFFMCLAHEKRFFFEKKTNTSNFLYSRCIVICTSVTIKQSLLTYCNNHTHLLHQYKQITSVRNKDN